MVCCSPGMRALRTHTRSELRHLTPSERRRVNHWLDRLPYYRSRLRIVVGNGLDRRGMHAASFLPQRHIVLDEDLVTKHRELARILYHEIFHFVWARLGNPLRQSYEDLLVREWSEGARGELGWSAEQRKVALAGDEVRRRSRQWSDYVCESFCDSAAWFCLERRREHLEWTLKPRFRQRRRRWFLASDVLPRLQL